VTERPVFTILGAGLAGPLLAVYLGRRGYRVHLIEMRPDPRRADAGGGRSINLALSERGLHALSRVGLDERARELSLPMRGRMMHAVSGERTFQPYGTRADQHLNSVSRSRLNRLLLEAALACPGVEVTFGAKCADFDPDAGVLELVDVATGGIRRERAEIVVGADGAFSRMRTAFLRRERFDFRQDYLDYGYKELSLPPTPEGGFALEPNALHIWPRHTYMMIALPNTDATFTCTLFWPYDGQPSFASIRTPEDILAFFRQTFPDAVPLMPDLVEEFQNHAVGSLVTVRCRPWQVGGRAVLLGDAAHAVVPFYGQGMNASFEDCTVLAECIDGHAPHWERAFLEYEARRRPHTDALAELAVENFVEMRDKVGSRAFLWRKRGERLLHRLFPRWYLPLYSMITFSRIPYAEARRRAELQDRVVLGVLGLLVLVAVTALVII
jgi:kynurenine 3-monooxygenase